MDVYGFTTTVEDTYINRVIEEAKGANILVAKEVSTVNADGRFANFFVLIKKDYLLDVAEKYPTEKFLTNPLAEVVFANITNRIKDVNGYASFSKTGVPHADHESVTMQIFSDIDRLKNLANDRTVKVTVATL